MPKGTNYSKTSSKMMWLFALLLVVFTVGCDRDHGGASGTTGSGLPTVTSVTPANATPGIAVNMKVTATFSESMSSATITAPGTFTVTGPFVTPVTGTVTYDGPSMTATFTPSGNLLNNTTYSATISTEAKNPAGAALANPFVWTFSTAVTPNTTAPLVSFTAPANGDTSVAINRNIIATFTEAMDPTTIIAANVLVTGPSGSVPGTVIYAASSFAATFAPTSNLASSATYTATITTGVKDLAGNPMAANFIWSFNTGTTADTTPPQVSSTNPANLAVNVPINNLINATFNEAMNPLTIISANFTLMDGVTPVTGTVAYDALNNIATFTPLSLLTPGTTYTALVTTGATDLAGNALVSGLVPNPWSFTTTAAPGPAIVINLGLANPFAIAAAAGMTNTPTAPVTTVNGDVVLTPTATCNGVAWPGCGGTAPIINGTVLFGADPAAIAVRADLLAAYNSITPASLPGAIVLGCGTIGSGGGAGAGVGCAGNSTLPPGVYISATASTIGVTGVLTLDGQGDANSQFIFQAPSALTTAAGALGVPGSEIRLINGAKASNIWWWVGSSATIGTYALFQGNVLADTSITMGTGSTSCGRLLAGAVTASGAFVFDSNVVSVPGNGCPL